MALSGPLSASVAGCGHGLEQRLRQLLVGRGGRRRRRRGGQRGRRRRIGNSRRGRGRRRGGVGRHHHLGEAAAAAALGLAPAGDRRGQRWGNGWARLGGDHRRGAVVAGRAVGHHRLAVDDRGQRRQLVEAAIFDAGHEVGHLRRRGGRGALPDGRQELDQAGVAGVDLLHAREVAAGALDVLQVAPGDAARLGGEQHDVVVAQGARQRQVGDLQHVLPGAAGAEELAQQGEGGQVPGETRRPVGVRGDQGLVIEVGRALEVGEAQRPRRGEAPVEQRPAGLVGAGLAALLVQLEDLVVALVLGQQVLEQGVGVEVVDVVADGGAQGLLGARVAGRLERQHAGDAQEQGGGLLGLGVERLVGERRHVVDPGVAVVGGGGVALEQAGLVGEHGEGALEERQGLGEVAEVEVAQAKLCLDLGPSQRVGDDLELEPEERGDHLPVAELAVDQAGALEGGVVVGVELEGRLVVHHGAIFAKEEILTELSQPEELDRAGALAFDAVGLALEVLEHRRPGARPAQTLFDSLDRIHVSVSSQRD